ncbi:TIGR02679 domain-containing protein [Streptomyces sp. CB03238]|uniref:TIGR02679 domain-containing protein n=1 Tax=Streptomyces sp. CB03238 TaxID=1907777 RepID=UPI001F4E54E4|nr:TIGR02679 domain-containing protein [Streptomyces sp. CB03238]
MAVNDGQPPAPVDRDRLARLLGGPDLAWLVDRVRRRMAREEALTGPVTLADPTPAQRAAAERLLGRGPGAGRSLSVRLDAVDAVLRRSGVSPGGLGAAVTALTGPVARVADVREREEQAWRDAYEPLGILIRTVRPELTAWADRLRGDGLVRRLARSPHTARRLLGDTAEALRRLPADPAVSLPAFAATAFGDAHALDDGTPLATLVLSGARALTGFPDGGGTEWRRGAWASAGLLKGALSSTVLTLGLRGTPAIDWAADAGEPVVLTLRQLTRAPPRTAPGTGTRTCPLPSPNSACASGRRRYSTTCWPTSDIEPGRRRRHGRLPGCPVPRQELHRRWSSGGLVDRQDAQGTEGRGRIREAGAEPEHPRASDLQSWGDRSKIGD